MATRKWLRARGVYGDGTVSRPSDAYGATGTSWLVVDGFDRVLDGSFTGATHPFAAKVGAATGDPFSVASNEAVAQGIVDLAEQAQITKQNASFLVDALEKAGYVYRTPDPSDARARLVRIAHRGAEAIPIAAAVVDPQGGSRLLNPAQMAALTGSLIEETVPRQPWLDLVHADDRAILDRNKKVVADIADPTSNQLRRLVGEPTLQDRWIIVMILAAQFGD